EVGAIAIFLADLFPEAGLAPEIGSPARGTYLRWIVFNHGDVEPAVMDKARNIQPGGLPPSALCYGSYDDMVNALVSAVRNGPYILGDRLWAADVVLGGAIRWMTLFKLLPEKPEFTSYIERITARPAFKSAMAKDQALVRALAS